LLKEKVTSPKLAAALRVLNGVLAPFLVLAHKFRVILPPSMERRLIVAGIAQVGVVAALRASLTRQLAMKHVKASNPRR